MRRIVHSNKTRLILSSSIIIGSVFMQLAHPSSTLFAQTQPTSETSSSGQTSIEASAPLPTGEISLTAIPPRLGDDFSLTAKPGETIQTSVRIRNSSGSPITITSSVEDFIVDEDGSTPIPVTEKVPTRWSLASWVTISPTSQTIAANSSGQINVVIVVPQDALPGGHYAMVLSQPANPALSGGITFNGKSESAIGQRVGSLLYLTIEGNTNIEALIRDFSFPQFLEFGPVPFSFIVENLSDVHIHPRISVEIFNIFGKKVDSLSLESKNIFPFIPRKYSGQWERVWGSGYYTAKATMSYGDQGQVAMATTAFWLLPVKLVLTGIVILLAFIACTVAIRRHLMHRSVYDKKRIQQLEKRVAELEDTKR